MRSCKRLGACGAAAAIAAATLLACSGDARDDQSEMGDVTMELQIAPGVTINTVNWAIANPLTGFSRAGTVNVRFSNTLQFQVGAIPDGSGYTIALTAMSADAAFTCSGAAAFKSRAGVTTPVSLTLTCSTAPGGGTIVVSGETKVCANLDSLGAAPLETAVNTAIALSATGSAGALPVSFAWTAGAGSFDDATSATPTFTCPATPQSVVITVTVSPSAPACSTTSRQSVTVTCDLVHPTFTNVYADIIGARCVGCHRPGGGGVTVGMLDMSTPSAAYGNLVGVNAMGIGAGTSGVTCASVTPPLVRVAPHDSAGSLIFHKVHSKLDGTQPPCGSPMPLPATALALTAAEIDLIAAWIDAGAQND